MHFYKKSNFAEWFEIQSFCHKTFVFLPMRMQIQAKGPLIQRESSKTKLQKKQGGKHNFILEFLVLSIIASFFKIPFWKKVG